MMRNEHGITIMGFLFVAVVVVTIALVGFRVMPAYIEYFAVKKALQTALEDAPSGTVGEVRRAFDRKAGAGYIESVQPSDIQVARQGGVITATATWQRVLPMIGNASILLDFDATASR
jgi:hypothetical protein